MRAEGVANLPGTCPWRNMGRLILAHVDWLVVVGFSAGASCRSCHGQGGILMLSLSRTARDPGSGESA